MLNKLLVKRILIIIALILIGLFVYFNLSAFMPVLLALLTAMIFEPFVKFLMRKFNIRKRLLSVSIVFTVFLIVSTFLIYITLTYLIESLIDWSRQIPGYINEIELFINDLIQTFDEFIAEFPQGPQIVRALDELTDNTINTALNWSTDFVAYLYEIIMAVPNMLIIGLVYLITLFLFSLDLPRLMDNFFNIFKSETADKLRYVFQRMAKVFLGWWKAQFIMSLGIFILTYLSLLYIAPGPALIVSFLVWLVDIIPLYVGPALILVPWGVVAMILGDVTMGVQLSVLAVILLAIRRIVEPKVLGDSIGLHALPTILSMYFGFVFFGVMGLILGPFVYMAIKSAKESGLFDIKWTENEKRDSPN
ncbi:sporulation integral membrane protein YtvI [Salicibibacter halophilus]|uniref:Sporulation integral membrane protein YtvI n=1 Tax=Salicibibacter halophilus TaxID=2502791 RepID=A0A514LF23_9BACI|nr:sporulation integral membrane protein YtvI [Salicibibacter halophilus]QDI89851.1 sporulation integral membrane protein YtvI [Salicibibacter halophilus]